MKFYKNNTFFWIWIFYFQKYGESRFWLQKQQFFYTWIFFFRKNKMKVSFGYEKKQFFGDKYGNCWQKLFVWSAIKTYEFLRKQHFFLHMNFLFQEQIKWKSVLAAKKAVFWEKIRKLLAKIIFFVKRIKTHEILRKQHFFWIWIFYFRKNTVKVGFWYRFWLRKQQSFLHMNFLFQKK